MNHRGNVMESLRFFKDKSLNCWKVGRIVAGKSNYVPLVKH